MKQQLALWLSTVCKRPGGDILAVQTLRNALMASSVLASAAMVAMMGVLATAKLHHPAVSLVAALLLAASTSCALVAIVRLARAGFELQLDPAVPDTLAAALLSALRYTQSSAWLLAVSLLTAAGGLMI